MNFTWTDEQLMIRNIVRDFAQHRVQPEVPRMEKEDRFPKELVEEMANLGLMGIPIPKELGGVGLDFTSYVMVIHEISKVSPALGVILSVHTSVGTNPIVHFGTNQQRQKYVTKLASGVYLGAFSLTEPGAGSDASALKTTAVKKGHHYLLNGTKMFITNGGAADTYIVFAKTNETGKDNEISAFIVEKSFPGCKVGKLEKKMGLHGSNTAEMVFEDCEVPAENLLGKPGEGFRVAMANLTAGRIGIAAQSLGIAEGAFHAALSYAKQRKQFGKSIASQQAVSFKLADMATHIEASKLLTYQAADAYDRNQPCKKASSMAKLFASKTAMETAKEAVQIFGGYGYTKEYPAERFFRDAKVCEIYEGTSEIQKIVIGKHVLGENT
ncbi:butyryl-CoA dehydrogenase [Alteribacillus persepolensis]|uniref:Acyl-CoA dehydrogenase n=1 Tax=Alteribacillus persepolensis TaxID=568899 RepID=A0A1G8G238_9BACI|nr:acyl-CoA dehydrogenase [Alteribacillus persepolensis]SDH88478.1 butyryl-CoA dehydrogenase [Alteribacillus persepolensis]